MGQISVHIRRLYTAYLLLLTLLPGVLNAAALSVSSESGEYIWALNCGNSVQDIRDSTGDLWMKDEEYSGLYRWGYISGSSASVTADISGTDNDEVFRSHRWGGTDMSYKIEVPNGLYEVELLFAETYWAGAGLRVFDLALEGSLVADDLDVYAVSGGSDTALSLVYTVTVEDKVLDISFPEVLEDNAFISGIKVSCDSVDAAEFLDFIQKKMFWFFLNEADASTGLVKDRENNWHIGYGNAASIAATGFGLSVLTVGTERGWISRSVARDRIMAALDSFDTLLFSINGFFYHLVDIDSGARLGSTEVSSVDTAIFLMGALQAGEYFRNEYPEILLKAEELYAKTDWGWLLDKPDPASDSADFISMGWKPEQDPGTFDAAGSSGYFSNYHWDSYNESVLVDLMAFGSPEHPVSTAAWSGMDRNWLRSGSYNYMYIPPLFADQYHHIYFDMRDIHDGYANYFENSRQATLHNRQVCMDDAQGRYPENIWGLTACDGESGYQVYGVPPDSSHDGTVAPTAAGTSIMFSPAESIDSLKEMYLQYKHHVWGRYGFCDAFNVPAGYRADEVLGIDNGPMILAIENYRSSMIRGSFMENSAAESALASAGFRAYSDSYLATASSRKQSPSYAIDGDTLTRWESEWSDDEWLTVDLGRKGLLNGLSILWETAYPSSYSIKLSTDKLNWETVYSTDSCPGGYEQISVAGDNYGRYVRIYCSQRATIWGNSIRELDIDAEFPSVPAEVSQEEEYSFEQNINNSIDSTFRTDWPVNNITMNISGGTFSGDLVMNIEKNTPPPSGEGVLVSGFGFSVSLSRDEQPLSPVAIILEYLDSDISGMQENLLEIGRYDETALSWRRLPSDVDAENNRISCLTDHFSVFALIQPAAASDFSGVNIYPNPFKPHLHSNVRIEGLIPGSSVRIFNLSGEKIWEYEDEALSGKTIWNGKTSSGRKVASGIYMVLAEDPEARPVVRKLAVIR
jgi:hypothetical protein